eukprot:5246821-Alexandrium_andersonii.AAC.1
MSSAASRGPCGPPTLGAGGSSGGGSPLARARQARQGGKPIAARFRGGGRAAARCPRGGADLL